MVNSTHEECRNNLIIGAVKHSVNQNTKPATLITWATLSWQKCSKIEHHFRRYAQTIRLAGTYPQLKIWQEMKSSHHPQSGYSLLFSCLKYTFIAAAQNMATLTNAAKSGSLSSGCNPCSSSPHNRSASMSGQRYALITKVFASLQNHWTTKSRILLKNFMSVKLANF
jgi:hypothetical protein